MTFPYRLVSQDLGYFEETARACGDAKAASNWLTNQVAAALKQAGGDLSTFGVSAARLGGLIRKQQEMGLNHKVAADVLAGSVLRRTASIVSIGAPPSIVTVDEPFRSSIGTATSRVVGNSNASRAAFAKVAAM